VGAPPAEPAGEQEQQATGDGDAGGAPTAPPPAAAAVGTLEEVVRDDARVLRALRARLGGLRPAPRVGPGAPPTTNGPNGGAPAGPPTAEGRHEPPTQTG
jgi:hypothetical protein